DQRANLELAQAQIRQCRDRLSDILAAGGQARMTAADCDNLHDAVGTILQQWSLLHPDMSLQIDNTLPETPASLQPFLADGIATLLDNAAEANAAQQATRLRFSASLQNDALLLELVDAGGGPAPAPGADPVDTGKPGRSGTGLMILRSNLDRVGGQLSFREHAAGCVARLSLPLPVAAPDGGALT
ncbi:MAG: hypothetical protein RIC38_07335, partial [Chromatocurvus sp.]